MWKRYFYKNCYTNRTYNVSHGFVYQTNGEQLIIQKKINFVWPDERSVVGVLIFRVGAGIFV